MPESVMLGDSIETGQPLLLGDIERRSGLYILGKPGMGKSALLVNIMNQDAEHGNGLFFLDPHADAITDLLNRGDAGVLSGFAKILDPEDEKYSFGINLLSCRDVTNLTERMDTYTRAYNVFFKLWEDEWGPWLQLILQNTLWAFIENPEYTLAEVPMFLNPPNSTFRNHIVGNIKHNPAVSEFWRHEFFERRERDQQERVDAALTRVTTLLTHPYVRHIVGQRKTTINFDAMLKPPIPTILLVKLSANLAADIKKFIGTILISELLHAVRNRSEREREQFCIFVDEFQNFTGADDFTTLITEGRKFGIATTIAHVERFGQFADSRKLLGATLAAVNKVFFQLIVPDAQELAPEFAKEATATEVRLEPELVISQEPFWDLLRRGHANRQIMELVRKNFQYLLDSYQKLREETEGILLTRADYHNQAELQRDEASIVGIDERRRIAIHETLSKESEWFVATGRDTPISLATLEKTEAAFERAMGLHNLAHRQTRLLQHYYNAIKGLRERFQDINRYMIAVMEGRTDPEPRQEPYISDFIDLFSKELTQAGHADVIGLYLKLKYKNPESLLTIPIYLIAKHWPEQINKPANIGKAIIKEDIIASRKGTYFSVLQDYTKDWHKHYLERGEDPIKRWDHRLSDPPPRQLTANEREIFIKVCVEDLLTDPNTPLQKVSDYIELFTLLRQPQNPIKVPSGQYVEKPVNVRLVSDMTNEMAQELANLPRFTAFAKVIEEKEDEQFVLKRKIKTLPLPPLQKPKNGKPDIESRVIENGHSLCKERIRIEEEIRQRQERWRRGRPSRSSPPPSEEPPPAHA